MFWLEQFSCHFVRLSNLWIKYWNVINHKWMHNVDLNVIFNSTLTDKNPWIDETAVRTHVWEFCEDYPKAESSTCFFRHCLISAAVIFLGDKIISLKRHKKNWSITIFPSVFQSVVQPENFKPFFLSFTASVVTVKSITAEAAPFLNFTNCIFNKAQM